MSQEIEITDQIRAEHGLTKDEYQKILDILGRTPNLVELGIFSVMWSEHCSYKTTRMYLKKLPVTGKQVICGPGENAGIIDIGDDDAIIFKVESHNHPSYIEPFQGAATGVGGIMRDIFTMGARPICNLNALSFGNIDHPKTKHLISGVTAGISSYGNSMGVPTVAGDCNFDEAYNGNILVNAMCVGLADKNKIFYSAASSVGSPVIYVGAKTGRDGIHGATMASAEFDDNSEAKRPTVQVGDPFTEKCLMEACLELMAGDAIIAIQDMGAAGLTCSSIEMADKGNCGIELNLDKVPMREHKMVPYELMLSESQERMLMILKPEKMSEAQAIFDKWEIDFAHIGYTVPGDKLILKFEDKIVANMPIKPLSDMAPLYDRPAKATPVAAEIKISSLKKPENIIDILKKMLSDPNIASKKYIWRQYDRHVMNDSLSSCNGDAALIRIHNKNKAVAVTTACNAGYCYANPKLGGMQAVVETYRNISAKGALPLAITNCLNFGNPEKPEIMGQLIACLEGISEACKYLDYPVVSGNVSLYNETNGKSILPTPTIGGVGLRKNLDNLVEAKFSKINEDIFIIGKTEGHLGVSSYLKIIENSKAGNAPNIDLEAEKKHGEFVRLLIENNLISACHDVASGGLLIAISQMIANSNIGADLQIKNIAIELFAYLFAEDQARYIITAKDTEKFKEFAAKSDIYFEYLGKTVAENLHVNLEKINIKELNNIYYNSLNFD